LSKVVARAELTEAGEAAARIARASPWAILAARRAIADNLRHSWNSMVAFEEELCAEMFEAPNAQEGRHACLEKLKPRFEDR